MPQLVDRLIGEAHDVEVDDRSAIGAGDDVHDPCKEGLDGVTGDDEGTGLHPLRLGSGIEERPDEARLIDLLHVSGKGDCDVLVLVHLRLPT